MFCVAVYLFYFNSEICIQVQRWKLSPACICKIFLGVMITLEVRDERLYHPLASSACYHQSREETVWSYSLTAEPTFLRNRTPPLSFVNMEEVIQTSTVRGWFQNLQSCYLSCCTFIGLLGFLMVLSASLHLFECGKMQTQ